MHKGGGVRGAREREGDRGKEEARVYSCLL
jgi:hypothetical protein